MKKKFILNVFKPINLVHKLIIIKDQKDGFHMNFDKDDKAKEIII